MVIAKTAGQLLNTGGSIATITTNNLTQTTGNFTAPATLNITGTATSALTLTAGTFTAGANVNINGDWINNGGTFTPGTNTVTFTGTGAQSIRGTAASQTFYHLTVSKTAGQLLNTAGSTVTLTTQNLTLTTGNMTAPATLNINGNLTLTDGTFTAGTTINSKGDWTHSSNGTAIFTPGTNTVNFTGTGSQTINGTANSETFYHVVINKTAGQLLNTGGSIATITTQNFTNTQGSFTAPSTLNINGNFTLTDGTFTATNTINIKGNWTHASTVTAIFTPASSTVNFTGTGTQTINGTKTSETFYDVVVNKTAGQLLNTGGSVVTLNTQGFTQTQGNFTAPATMTINGDVVLTTGTFTAGATLNIKGNWSNNGATFTPGTNSVLFNSTANAQTIGGSSSTTFYNLTTNNTFATTANISLGINTSITNQLTMTSGKIDLAGNTLTLGTAAATPGTLVCTPSTSNFMSGGSFRRWFNTTTIAYGNVRGLFPMGTITGGYNSPIYVSAPATAPTTGGTITASYTHQSSITGLTVVDGASTIERRNDATWTLATANGLAGGSYNLMAERAFCATCVGALTDLRLMLSGSVIGTAGTNSGSLTQPQVLRNGLTLSDLSNTFYIGSINFLNTPLPIELLNFNAIAIGNTVELKWSTASEQNNDFFTIEKSKDGINYSFLQNIDGAGNSSIVNHYQCTDHNPYSGLSAYRLKQTDFNGDTTYSNPVYVNFYSQPNITMLVYPNPSDGSLIQLNITPVSNEKMQLKILDAIGKQVYSNNYELNENEVNKLTIQPIEKLTQGIYFITVETSTNRFNTKFNVN